MKCLRLNLFLCLFCLLVCGCASHQEVSQKTLQNRCLPGSDCYKHLSKIRQEKKQQELAELEQHKRHSHTLSNIPLLYPGYT